MDVLKTFMWLDANKEAIKSLFISINEHVIQAYSQVEETKWLTWEERGTTGGDSWAQSHYSDDGWGSLWSEASSILSIATNWMGHIQKNMQKTSCAGEAPREGN